MIQIISEKRKPSLGEKFSNAAGVGLEQLSKFSKENKQKEAIGKLGIDSNLSPEFQKMALQAKYDEQYQKKQLDFENDKFSKQQKEKIDKLQGKKAEKIEPLKNAIKSIDEMIQIRGKGKLGFANRFTSLFGGEAARDKGQYQTLGNSLIQFASQIPIRNRQEFEKLAGHISDPNITDAEAEGILNELRNIIGRSLSSELGEEMGGKTGVSSNQNFDLQELSTSSASQHKDRVVEDEEGNRYKSNGTKWVKI